MRVLTNFCVAVACLVLVSGGLYLTLAKDDEIALQIQPGQIGRIVSGDSSATASFTIDGEALELKMVFDGPEDSDDVIQTRVRLVDGQSHSIVLGSVDEGTEPQRYQFRRDGLIVEMTLSPARPLNTSFAVSL